MKNGSLYSLVVMWLEPTITWIIFGIFFQLHPINDDAEDLAMKIFSNTLHGNAREWYDDLPDASITYMD
jgi:hypothetical protein